MDISDKLNRESHVGKLKSEPDEIVSIGRCSGCLKTKRLHDYSCRACKAIFGQKCGVLFQRIREDEKFAAKFYNALMVHKKESFISLFGVPTGCLAPGEKSLRDSRPHLRVVTSKSTQTSEDSKP